MSPQGILGLAVSLLDSIGILPLLTAFMIVLIATAILSRLIGRD